MELQETRKILNSFAKYVIQQAKSNLTKRKKNVSKSLYNSLDYKILQDSSGSILQFLMEEYGAYQDQGVSGTKKKYNTPFKYTTKRPPASVFDKWTIRKGIAPRQDGGQFAKRKGLNFIIAKSIFEQGIKPSLFFTKPFEKRFETLPNDLIAAFVNDAEKTIENGDI
mgnify:FL=1|jgi:hypothetical protein|tara:strand:+ start:10447 stop:10947 length:501 start_codon:yes stop_codon:yes gene_type:complete